MTTDIISAADTRLGELFDHRMALVDASFREASTHLSNGWWALWETYCDGSWRTRFEHINDWIGDLRANHKVGRSDFFATMSSIKNLKALDVPDDKIKDVLGQPRTAFKGDLARLMQGGALMPDVAERVEQAYGSPALFIEAVSNADPGTGRRMMTELRQGNRFYWVTDPVYLGARGEVLCNAVWENETGLVGRYTFKISVRNITTGQNVPNPTHLPLPLAKWILGELGLKLD